MVSNDIFKFCYQIKNFAYEFRQWMFNKRVSFKSYTGELKVIVFSNSWQKFISFFFFFQINFFQLKLPPTYAIRPHELTASTWLIPYHKNISSDSMYEIPKNCLVIKKIK